MTPETDALYRYEEAIRVREGDHWMNYNDSFQIRHWEHAQVLDAVERAGLAVEEDLSDRFLGAGSNYDLAGRPPRST